MMMACGQAVNYAWREGIDASEVEPVFEQAMALARKLKDVRAAALITMAFGRVLAATGWPTTMSLRWKRHRGW